MEAAAAARALEAAYTSLGRQLLAAGRFTKAQQHFSQGVELFRSLGAPASTAAMCVQTLWGARNTAWWTTIPGEKSSEFGIPC